VLNFRKRDQCHANVKWQAVLVGLCHLRRGWEIVGLYRQQSTGEDFITSLRRWLVAIDLLFFPGGRAN